MRLVPVVDFVIVLVTKPNVAYSQACVYMWTGRVSQWTVSVDDPRFPFYDRAAQGRDGPVNCEEMELFEKQPGILKCFVNQGVISRLEEVLI